MFRNTILLAGNSARLLLRNKAYIFIVFLIPFLSTLFLNLWNDTPADPVAESQIYRLESDDVTLAYVVDYYRYPTIQEAYAELHRRGYRIVATLPHENDQMIGDLDISQPTALVFGTELTGLTGEAIDGADAYVKIPMYGFTESFNISVCAALSLFSLTERMRRSDIRWQLDDDELLDLKLHWAMQAIRDGEKVVKQLMFDI